MQKNIYRPLVRITKNTQQNTCIPFDYHYTLHQISTLKKHLPKVLTLVGVDAQHFEEEDERQLKKQNLKLKAVNGRSVVNQELFKFYGKNQLAVALWSECHICVDIPFNSKQNPQKSKEQLDQKLQNYIDQHFHLLHTPSHKLIDPHSQQQLKIDQIQPYFEPSQLPSKHFDKQYRQVRMKIPVAVYLSKKDKITAGNIISLVKNDILNSIKIMIRNEMPIRILQVRNNIALQSFVKKGDDEPNQRQKLANMLVKKKQSTKISKQEQQAINEQQPVGEARQDPSNRTLLLVLIGLASLYIFLKMYPLKQILEL